MIGAIIGDIIGSRSDLKDIDVKNSELFTDECHITGNTVMMLASAKAIMKTDKEILPSLDRGRNERGYYHLLCTNVTRYLREFGSKYSKYDYGEELEEWISGDIEECFDDSVILRIIPVGFCSWSHSEVKEMSDAIASGTLKEFIGDFDLDDDHEDGSSGFKVDYSISEYIFEVDRSHIKTNMSGFSVYGGTDNKNFIKSLKTDDMIFNALKAVGNSKSFEEAVRMAVMHGGSFTGAVAGAISEAYFGVPEKYKEKVCSYLDNELLSVLDDWISFSNNVATKGRFKLLTRHIPTISVRKSFDDMYAEIRYDNKERPFHLPIPIDSYQRDEIKYDIISLIDTYSEYGLNEYRSILNDNGIECSWNGMVNADYDSLDAQCVLAILTNITSSERFTDGTTLNFFNDGHLLRALKRLSDIDHVKAPPVEEICLSYGGFSGGYKDHHLVFGDTAKLTIKNSYSIFNDYVIEKEYSIEETNAIIKVFNEIHVEYWNNSYCDPGVLDGTQWSLIVKYKGQRGMKFSGSNAFPKNFGSLTKIFNINYGSDDDFDIDRLVFGLERSFVMNEKGELEQSPGRVVETLTIDRNKNQVVHERTVNSEKVSHSYNTNIGMAKILAFAGDCIRAKGWNDTLKRDTLEGSSYFTFKAELDTGDEVSHYGGYDSNSIPEEPWTLFIKSVRTYLERFVTQDIMYDQTFDRTPRNGKVRFCNVLFDDAARSYYYRTEDGMIKKGDRVRVTFGIEERIGVVIEAANYDLDEVPFSMEKTRDIICKMKE